MTHIPDEAVQAAEAQFTEYFLKNYPKDCIIYNPAWHAPKIFRAAKAAITENTPNLPAPCAVEVVDRAKRIANIYRNKDDATVIASFHKETARVIDELLSCVVSNPVDVAAVRRHAFEEGFENGVEQSLNALDAYDDITRNEAEHGIRKLKPDYRALSAEPAQGEQSDRTALAQGGVNDE